MFPKTIMKAMIPVWVGGRWMNIVSTLEITMAMRTTPMKMRTTYLQLFSVSQENSICIALMTRHGYVT